LHFCTDSLNIFVEKESRVFKRTLMVVNVRKVPLSTLGTIFSLKCPTARNNTHCLPNLSERKLPNLSERNKIKMEKRDKRILMIVKNFLSQSCQHSWHLINVKKFVSCIQIQASFKKFKRGFHLENRLGVTDSYSCEPIK